MKEFKNKKIENQEFKKQHSVRISRIPLWQNCANVKRLTPPLQKVSKYYTNIKKVFPLLDIKSVTL